MKKILIASYDMEIGGVERSLIGLLNSFDYKKYDVDLFLCNHKGEFLNQIPPKTNVLPEIEKYSTVRKPMKQILSRGHLILASARLLSKVISKIKAKKLKMEASNSYLVRTMYYSLPFFPIIKNQYDVAISFLTPHYVVSDKVSARLKIAYIHTDYTVIDVEPAFEIKMWNKFDYIIAISEECKQAFIKTFPALKDKCIVIENILSPRFVREQSNVDVTNEILKDDSIKICSVGRFTYQKGFDEAVKACKKLVDMGYNIKWYIIGYGSDEQLIRNIIDENNMQNNFIILGKRINPYPYMKQCDIYVQPSRYEGKAVTVREAQMLGKPVIITDFPTAKSQLENGVDGFICPLNIDGVVDGIKTLIDDADLRNKLAYNASQRNYGNEKEIERIYKIID